MTNQDCVITYFNCEGFGHKKPQCPQYNKICTKCTKKGHSVEECRTPVCCWCKEVGHKKYDCVEREKLVCYNCMQYGHTTKKCRAKQPWCPECKKDGHLYKDCKIATKKRNKSLNESMDGFNSCAAGMADMEEGLFLEYMRDVICENEKNYRLFKMNRC